MKKTITPKPPIKLRGSDYDKPGWFVKIYGDKPEQSKSWYKTMPPMSPPIKPTKPIEGYTMNIMQGIQEAENEKQEVSGR